VNARLQAGGFDEALAAALAAQDVLAADETPVNVLDKTPVPAPGQDDAGEADPEEKDGRKAAAGAPHVLVVTTPDAWLRLLLAMASRRKADVGAGIPAAFTGYLMTGGYAGYQHLLDRIAGIQQCCQHVIRRARGDTALNPKTHDDLRERYDKAAAHGIIHNLLRDWASGNHPAPSATRPSPATGTPWPPSPAGAASAATSTPRPRHHRTRRHPRRPHRKPLATATPRNRLTQVHGPREWTPPFAGCRRAGTAGTGLARAAFSDIDL
jgi:hypothetical protein